MHEQAGGVRAQRSWLIEWCPGGGRPRSQELFTPKATGARAWHGTAARVGSAWAGRGLMHSSQHLPRALRLLADADRVSRCCGSGPPAARACGLPRPPATGLCFRSSWLMGWDCRARRLHAIATVMAREAVLEFIMFFSTRRQC